MNERQRMLRRLSSLKFPQWDLHIFLDTHPGNCEAARKLEDYQKKIDELTRQYEEKFGPVHESGVSRWAWISGPWPWEIGEGDD